MKLTSPNYPEAYDPLEDCTWTITAPQGYYVTLDFIIIDVSDNYFTLPSIFNLTFYKYILTYISYSLTVILMMITYPYKRLMLMQIKNC